MKQIDLDRLVAHPDNANVMPAHRLSKLAAHIKDTGWYPPLIVRQHPDQPDRFQLLDGHHRAEVLRQLGHRCAICDVWEVDDNQAAMLLLTLNRLQGDDDPQRRGLLLKRLAQDMDITALAARLPDDVQQIERLIALTQPPPPPAAPQPLDDMPCAVTFFLTTQQRRSLLAKLRAVHADRSAALITLLALDVPITAPAAAPADAGTDAGAHT